MPGEYGRYAAGDLVTTIGKCDKHLMVGSTFPALPMEGPRDGTEWLFVYGTLRRGGANAIARDYADAEFAGNGAVHGHLIDFGGYPGLRLDPSANKVMGEIYAVSPQTLACLDDLERYYPEAGIEACEYLRLKHPVRTTSGRTIECWLYEVRSSLAAGQPVIAGGDWIAHAQQPAP